MATATGLGAIAMNSKALRRGPNTLYLRDFMGQLAAWKCGTWLVQEMQFEVTHHLAGMVSDPPSGLSIPVDDWDAARMLKRYLPFHDRGPID